MVKRSEKRTKKKKKKAAAIKAAFAIWVVWRQLFFIAPAVVSLAAALWACP